MYIRTVASKDRVRTDGNRYEQIACRAAVYTGITLTALLDGLTIVDTGRNVDLELAGLADTTLTAALRTRLLDDLAGAAAVRAGALRLEHAERRALSLRNNTGAAAVRTGLRRGALCGTCAAAVITGFDALDRDLLLTAECGFLEGQDHRLTDGFAALRCVAARRTSAAKAAAEERTEQVAQIAHVKAAAEAACTGTAAVARVHTGKAELVVLGALLLVGQHLVCFVYFLELIRSLRIILVEVRVVLARQLAVCLFQLIITCALLYAEHFIIISFISHKKSSYTQG